MSSARIDLDVTPWVRGPYSGVGRSALLSALAAAAALKNDKRLGDTRLRFVQRSATKPLEAVFRDQDFRVEPLLPWRRLMGEASSVYHSFEHGMPRLLRSRRVMTLHDCWTLRTNVWQSKEFQARQRPRLLKALARSHRIVVPSRATFDELATIDKALMAKTRVIPWGPTLQVPVTGDHALVRGEAPRESVAIGSISPFHERTDSQTFLDDFLASGEPYYLVVANFENRKNHKIILTAFEKSKGLALVLAGSKGHGFEKVEKHIEKLKGEGKPVYVFERLDEEGLKKLYRHCRALVSASFEEGFGLPVLEAMTFAKPLILSRIPAHEEIAGDAALYFQPELGLPELSEFWAALRDDNYLARELGERAKERAAKFSWERHGRELLDTYASIL